MSGRLTQADLPAQIVSGGYRFAVGLSDDPFQCRDGVKPATIHYSVLVVLIWSGHPRAKLFWLLDKVQETLDRSIAEHEAKLAAK